MSPKLVRVRLTRSLRVSAERSLLGPSVGEGLSSWWPSGRHPTPTQTANPTSNSQHYKQRRRNCAVIGKQFPRTRLALHVLIVPASNSSEGTSCCNLFRVIIYGKLLRFKVSSLTLTSQRQIHTVSGSCNSATACTL